MCKDRPPLERAIEFHGHICPGLLMGVRVAEFAQKFLDVDQDQDEELVAIVEHKSCGVDAVQAILGCTFGKGNLIFKDYGKQVYVIASRDNNRAVRISHKLGSRSGPKNDRYRELAGMDILTADEANELEDLRGFMFEDIMGRPFEELFEYREVPFALPPKAAIYPTVKCEVCGEGVMEPKARKTDQGWACPECIV